MTTETAPDPVVEAWSDNLEEELVEAGMEQAQAKAYRRAFELGLTRVISQTATRQELQQGLASLRQEIADLRQEMAELRRETRQEIADLRSDTNHGFAGLRAEFKKELHDAISGLRSEVRFTLLLGFGVVTALLSALLAVVA